MTISTTHSRKEYVGNGVLATYPFDFPITVSGDLVVYVASALQTLGVHYTLTGTFPGTGSVVFAAGSIPANLAAIVIERDTPLTQATDLNAGEKFYEETIEQMVDKTTILLQQLKNRALLLPKGQAVGGPVSAGTPVALGYLRWNALLSALEAVPMAGVPSTAAEDIVGIFPDIIAQRPWIDVRAYGAVGDGVTDDTAAIQAAIDATLSGYTLYFPATAAFYLVTDTPTVTKAIHIKGDGWRFVPGGGLQGSIIRQEGGVLKDALLLDGTVNEIDGMLIENIALGGTAASRYALHFEGGANTGVNRSSFRNICLAGAGTAGLYNNGLSVLNHFDHVIMSMGFTSPAGYAVPTRGFHLRGSFGNSVMTNCGAAGVTTAPGYGWHFDSADGLLLNLPESEGNTVGWRFDGTNGGIIFIQPYHEANGTVIEGTSTSKTNLVIGSSHASSTTLDLYTAGVGVAINSGGAGANNPALSILASLLLGALMAPHVDSPKGQLHVSKDGVTATTTSSAVEGGGPVFFHSPTNLADVLIAHFQGTGALADFDLRVGGGGSFNLGDAVLSTWQRSTGGQRNVHILKLATDVIATGSLPAAAASEDGRVVIENAGAGDRNLIIYAGGQRFRIDGGAAF